MSYATIEDLEARYGELSSELEDRATVLLDDAATIIDAYVTADTTDERWLARARLVSCAMVNRAMQASESDAYGVSQATMTAGPYTQNVSYSNPSGDLYLTVTEKRTLSIGAPYIGELPPQIAWVSADD